MDKQRACEDLGYPAIFLIFSWNEYRSEPWHPTLFHRSNSFERLATTSIDVPIAFYYPVLTSLGVLKLFCSISVNTLIVGVDSS